VWVEGWRSCSSHRAPAEQEQDPEFKPQYHQIKKKGKTVSRMVKHIPFLSKEEKWRLNKTSFENMICTL
jgi:hypothetical protein